MTIEQLLCPAVINWEKNFRKKLNENHINMSNEQIIEEFDKWLIENEDVINKSVEDNIEHINETIQRNMKKHNKLNEGIVDDDAFDDDEDGNGEIDVDFTNVKNYTGHTALKSPVLPLFNTTFTAIDEDGMGYTGIFYVDGRVDIAIRSYIPESKKQILRFSCIAFASI